MTDKCPWCGSDVTVEYERPSGCVCDPGSWGDVDIPGICDAYEGSKTTYCSRCEHDMKCHDASSVTDQIVSGPAEIKRDVENYDAL